MIIINLKGQLNQPKNYIKVEFNNILNDNYYLRRNNVCLKIDKL